ncbi:ATP-dependent zinc protease [Desulfuromonas acetoxidans]|nr:ATP-dependent zinc protease [Desulfuromonas acetoxidans]NVD24168.1 ATP-dependent zinc protease [Desulfuromonas acetoxidans]NVE15059.1 ATP-dependent zinc protease [Desulfuromonas acetoxidans]
MGNTLVALSTKGDFLMIRRFYFFSVLVAVPLLLTTAGCKPYFVLATQQDKIMLEQVLDQETQQLDQLDRLTGRLESMQDDLVANQSQTVTELQQKMANQDEQLVALKKQLAELNQAFDSLKQERFADVVRYNDMQSVAVDTDTTTRQVIGAVEQVYISPPGVLLNARIDTGATTSSIDARNIEPFERDGKRWVRFEISDPENDEPVVLECRVVRRVKIIQAITEEKERRYVVELLVALGNVTRSAEFTLSDRAHVEYPVLIGRNILMDSMTVDVSKKFLSVPTHSR